MLEKLKTKLKIKNSTILLIGIVIIVIGFSLGFLEYFKEKKNKAFTEINVLLYENEMPESIETEENYTEEQPIIEEPIVEEPIVEEPIKYDYIGILEIPKINLRNGFLAIDSIYNNVSYNVTVINGSTFPDIERSNLILAAHSGNCYICYFDKLYKLKKGDNAYIYYNNYKYTYEIVNIYEEEKDGTVAIYRDYSKSGLTLITCTRNSNTKQTVYILDLVNKEQN